MANQSAVVNEGDIFVCEINASHNGHHSIPEAVTRGASLIIAKLTVPLAEAGAIIDFDPMDPDKSVRPLLRCLQAVLVAMKGFD